MAGQSNIHKVQLNKMQDLMDILENVPLELNSKNAVHDYTKYARTHTHTRALTHTHENKTAPNKQTFVLC